jgi:hypothetical protein
MLPWQRFCQGHLMSRPHLIPILASLFVMPAGAGTAVWKATLGFPQDVNAAWVLDDSSAFDPALGGGKMTLTTGSNEGQALMSYGMQGADIKYPKGVAYYAEAVVRVVSGGSIDSSRSPVTIAYTFPNGNFVWFGLGTSNMFLLKANTTIGWTRTDLDTTSFHKYRIEVAGQKTGSLVTVYQDGVQVMQGPAVWHRDDAPRERRLAFGDYTISAYGVSEWKSFKTNIAACKASKIIVNC